MDSRSIFLRPRRDQTVVAFLSQAGLLDAQALVADAGGGGDQKSSEGEARPVPKLTQVGVVNNLRRSRERS